MGGKGELEAFFGICNCKICCKNIGNQTFPKSSLPITTDALVCQKLKQNWEKWNCYQLQLTACFHSWNKAIKDPVHMLISCWAYTNGVQTVYISMPPQSIYNISKYWKGATCTFGSTMLEQYEFAPSSSSQLLQNKELIIMQTKICCPVELPHLWMKTALWQWLSTGALVNKKDYFHMFLNEWVHHFPFRYSIHNTLIQSNPALYIAVQLLEQFRTMQYYSMPECRNCRCITWSLALNCLQLAVSVRQEEITYSGLQITVQNTEFVYIYNYNKSYT